MQYIESHALQMSKRRARKMLTMALLNSSMEQESAPEAQFLAIRNVGIEEIVPELPHKNAKMQRTAVMTVTTHWLKLGIFKSVVAVLLQWDTRRL